MNEFKKYKASNWEFNQLGNAKYNGINKVITTGKVYVSGNMLNVVDILNDLFKEPVKPKIKDAILIATKLEHGNKGRKHTLDTKIKIGSTKSKSIVMFGVSYRSIQDAAKSLNVNRSTLYRINKKSPTK